MACAVGGCYNQFVVSLGAPVEIAAHNVARLEQNERLAHVVVHKRRVGQRQPLNPRRVVDAVGERMVLLLNLFQLG